MLASLPSSLHRKSEPEQEKRKRREICRIVMIGETVKTSQRRKAHYMEGMKNTTNYIERLRKEGTLAFESDAYFIPFISRLPLFSRPAQEGVRAPHREPGTLPAGAASTSRCPSNPKAVLARGHPLLPPAYLYRALLKNPFGVFCLPSSSQR